MITRCAPELPLGQPTATWSRNTVARSSIFDMHHLVASRSKGETSNSNAFASGRKTMSPAACARSASAFARAGSRSSAWTQPDRKRSSPRKPAWARARAQSERRLCWRNRVASLDRSTDEMPGLSPTARGVPDDLVEHGFVQTVFVAVEIALLIASRISCESFASPRTGRALARSSGSRAKLTRRARSVIEPLS